jgi:hypothetical protein
MVINLDSQVGGPLLASGKATTEGEAVAVRYKQLRDLIDTLEAEREALREIILAEADKFPNIKSFPAGDLIIRVGQTSRETVPAAKVRTERPDIYEQLTAAGFVNKSTAKTLSIK